MKFEATQLLLYAITDRHWAAEKSLDLQVREALEGGVTCVQLREKGMTQAELLQEASRLTVLCHTYGVPLIINDNWKVALSSGADGVHLGMEDDSIARVRQEAGPDFIIGATAKTVEQAQLAQAAGADYLGVGAVFPSPTKQNAIRITREELHRICTSVSIPAVAIGGITAENVAELTGGGMQGLAVVSAIFGADHPRNAAKQLKQIAQKLVAR